MARRGEPLLHELFRVARMDRVVLVAVKQNQRNSLAGLRGAGRSPLLHRLKRRREIMRTAGGQA